jgi:hypothetical protein
MFEVTGAITEDHQIDQAIALIQLLRNLIDKLW